MKNVFSKTETQRILDLEYFIGIPNQAETFQEQVNALMQEMDSSGRNVNKKFLLTLVQRQDAFLSKFDERV